MEHVTKYFMIMMQGHSLFSLNKYQQVTDISRADPMPSDTGCSLYHTLVASPTPDTTQLTRLKRKSEYLCCYTK